MKVEKGYKLFDDTYLFVLDKCLAVVKVDENGQIVRVSTFGERKEDKE